MMLRRTDSSLAPPRRGTRFTIAGLLLAGTAALALVAPAASGMQDEFAGVESAWSITVKDVRNLPENAYGDDGSYPDGVLCLYDDRTWLFLGFCDAGRWIADPKKKDYWLQGGCEGFDVYTAIDIKNTKRGRGKIHEWYGTASPYTHVAATHKAVRNADEDVAACTAAQRQVPGLAPFLAPAGKR